VWNELADWYLESVKGRLAADAEPNDREVARSVLLHVFDGALRLLHPIVPFITEALWQKLPGRAKGEYLIRASWPEAAARSGARRGADFELVREAVLAVRQIRGDYNVAPAKTLDVIILAKNDARVYQENAGTIGRLARSRVSVSSAAAPEGAAHVLLRGDSEVVVPLAGLIDVDKECQRLRGELEALEKQIVSREQRLANPKYVERAPEHVVRSDRATLEEMVSKRGQLTEKVRALCGT
jgi:valyl-tRNA synthetase